MGKGLPKNELADEVKKLNTQLMRQDSLGRRLVTGMIYGVGFFIGSAIIAVILVGILGPWVGKIGWVHNSFETGLQLLHGE